MSDWLTIPFNDRPMYETETDVLDAMTKMHAKLNELGGVWFLKIRTAFDIHTLRTLGRIDAIRRTEGA